MAVSRKARAGCSAGKLRICCRMSGDALNRSQFRSSVLTAMEDCVRGLKRGSPWRQAWQLGQLQFHWGNPPPAAEPRTCTFKLQNPWCQPGTTGAPEGVTAGRLLARKRATKKSARRVATAGWPQSAVGDVHRDFKTKAHVDSSRFFPVHTISPIHSIPQKRGFCTVDILRSTEMSVPATASGFIAGIWICIS